MHRRTSRRISRRFGPFKDSKGIWQVGMGIAEFTLFTLDLKPPAFLPEKNHYIYLLMRQAHEKCHSEVSGTMIYFRLAGY